MSNLNKFESYFQDLISELNLTDNGVMRSFIYKLIPIFEKYEKLLNRIITKEMFFELSKPLMSSFKSFAENYNYQYMNNQPQIEYQETGIETYLQVKLEDLDLSFIDLGSSFCFRSTSFYSDIVKKMFINPTSFYEQNQYYYGSSPYYLKDTDYSQASEKNFELDFIETVYDQTTKKYLVGGNLESMQISYFNILLLKYLEKLNPNFGELLINVKTKFKNPPSEKFPFASIGEIKEAFRKTNNGVINFKNFPKKDGSYDVSLTGGVKIKDFFKTDFRMCLNEEKFLEFEYIAKRIAVAADKFKFDFKINSDSSIEFILNGKTVTKEVIDLVIAETCIECNERFANVLNQLNEQQHINQELSAKKDALLSSLKSLNNEISLYNGSLKNIFTKLMYRAKPIELFASKKDITESIPSFTNINDYESLKVASDETKKYSQKTYCLEKENAMLEFLVTELNRVFISQKDKYEAEQSKKIGLKANIDQVELEALLIDLKNKYDQTKPNQALNLQRTEQKVNEAFVEAISYNSKQATLLSEKERQALIYYKLLFYRPINQILDTPFKFNKEVTEETENILKSCFKNVSAQLQSIDYNPFEKENNNPNRRDYNIVSKNLSYDEYKKIILETTNILLDGVMSKIGLESDLTVYRAVAEPQTLTKGFGKGRLLSTSSEKSEILEFLKARCSYEDNLSIYEIHLSKGSPVVMFTSGIWLFDDSKTPESMVFPDAQQEILIDPDLFDFEIESIDQSYSNFYFRPDILKKISIIKVLAKPKKVIDMTNIEKSELESNEEFHF